MMSPAIRAVTLAIPLGLFAAPVVAETLVAARTIPARSVLDATDVALTTAVVPGAHRNPADIVGLEAQITIYAGRPIRLGDVGPAALIDRNELVTLRFRTGALVIETEGRALDRGAQGVGVRVMNNSSRNVVVGRVIAPGLVEVSR